MSMIHRVALCVKRKRIKELENYRIIEVGSLKNRVYSTAGVVFVPKTTTIARVSWFFRGLEVSKGG